MSKWRCELICIRYSPSQMIWTICVEIENGSSKDLWKLQFKYRNMPTKNRFPENIQKSGQRGWNYFLAKRRSLNFLGNFRSTVLLVSSAPGFVSLPCMTPSSTALETPFPAQNILRNTALLRFLRKSIRHLRSEDALPIFHQWVASLCGWEGVLAKTAAQGFGTSFDWTKRSIHISCR